MLLIGFFLYKHCLTLFLDDKILHLSKLNALFAGGEIDKIENLKLILKK